MVQQKSYQAISLTGLHRVAYREWGERDAPVVICVHGLTRNGRDFDDLATDLARDFRVICPDVVGRGASDRLADPTHYGIPQYVGDMTTLIARLDVEEVQWVGTSMGGLIGMTLAADPNTPIKTLIINDVGPVLPHAALKRIGDYLQMGAQQFATLDDLEEHLRLIHAPFGKLTDAQWRHLATISAKPSADGGVTLHYDPAISEPFRSMAEEDLVLWPIYDMIQCPIRVIRGAQSDLLPAEVAREMMARKTDAALWEVEDAGHAPALMAEDQIAKIRHWLSASDSS